MFFVHLVSMVCLVTACKQPVATAQTANDQEVQLAKKWYPGHYAREVSDFAIEPVKDLKEFRGFIHTVAWAEMEPEKDKYDFTSIRNAISVAEKYDKKLIVGLSDHVNNNGKGIPDYLKTPDYAGGFYTTKGRNDRGQTFAFSYPKAWLPAYQVRWNKYIAAVGAEFDTHPTLAGISFIESSRYAPVSEPTYSGKGMIDFFRSQNAAAAAAFPKTIVFQYLNFVQQTTQEQKDELARYLVEDLGNGMGSPDIFNHSRGQYLLKHNQFRDSFIKYKNSGPLCIQAQHGAFQGGSAKETFHYSVDTVGLHFFGWVADQRTKTVNGGYTIFDVIDVLKEEKGRINTCPPANIMVIDKD